MKKRNTYNTDKLLLGLNFGDHKVNPDSIVDEIKKEVKGKADMFILRCKPTDPLPMETYVELAKFAKNEGLFFAILYAYQHPPKGERSHLNKQTVAKIIDIAGEFFLGEVFAETGSQSVSQDKGYFEIKNDYETLVKPPQDFKDMHQARTYYVEYIRSLLKYNKDMGIKNSMMIEPTAIGAYDLEGGISTLMLELLPADSEKLVAITRGATIGHQRKEWGGFVAHEWYGGYVHDDVLKQKRLDLAYKYLYMEGANYIFLESGNTGIESFGYNYDYDHPLCKRYRDYTAEFYKFAKQNKRLNNGPITNVAFIFGEDDGYSEFLGSHAWCQFDKEEWGQNEREKSWQILNEVYRPLSWHEQENVSGDGVDLSSSPAYGSYDVIPACAPLSVLQNYEYLIFVGHNTMSEELYNKLDSYVKDGGVLLASACHMKNNSLRTENNEYIYDGDFSKLFGVKVNGVSKKNKGIKFYKQSLVKNMVYPATLDLECDANYPSGYSFIANVELNGANVCARLCDTFLAPSENDEIILTEYKNGKGVAMFLAYANYPGHPAVYPVYKKIVKELLTTSHRNAQIKVFGSEKVRFAVYRDNGKTRIYLLNTSFDVPNTVGIIYKDKTTFVTLDATELKHIDF